MSNVSNFISQNLAYANSVSSNTGIPASDILGQWGLETGWGSHFAGSNNFGNVSPGGIVANYPTPEAGAAAYQSVLLRDNASGKSPATFAASLVAAGYATDPNYAASLTGAINTVGANLPSNVNPITGLNSPWDNLSPINDSINLSSALDKINPTMQGLYNQVTGTSSGQSAADKAVSGGTGTPVSDWVSTHVGNYGLVIFGGILILGALLISQKNNVIQMAKV